MMRSEGYHWDAIPLFVVTTLIAGGVFAGLALVMHRQQGAVLSAGVCEAQVAPDGRARPLAQVCEAVRAMKLVTTAVSAPASKSVVNDCWRGTTTASVEAPVTYHYGVNLASLEVGDVLPGMLPDSYRVVVPPPERIAVEVDMARRKENVSVSGFRLRSRSGEFVLGQARLGVQDAAREAVLPPETAARVRDEARTQVRELVRRIAGERAAVEVVFRDE